MEGHVGGNRCEFQADQGDDGTHRGGRKNHVEPFAASEADDERDDSEDETGSNKAAQSMLESNAGGFGQGDACDRRSDKGEARSKEGRSLAAADEGVDECSDAVHHQHESRVDDCGPCRLIEEDRNQDGGAEHGKEMLQAQRNALEEGHLLIDLNGLAGWKRERSLVAAGCVPVGADGIRLPR